MNSLIAAAAAIGVTANETQIEQFRRYRDLLIEWGQRMNLTGIKDPDAIVEELFIRSLRVAVQAGGTETTAEWFDDRRIIDIGSGAGFPGLPLKLLQPGAKVTLLESSRKKCDFMEHVIDDLGLEGVWVVNARAEDAAHERRHRETYDLATARGVARLSILAEYTLPFLKMGGVAVLPKGSDAAKIQAETEAAAHAADVMGAAPAFIQPVAHPGNSETDQIVYWMKIQRTPKNYPRRAGIPSKRPLTAVSSNA